MIAAVVAALGAIAAWRFLPARAQATRSADTPAGASDAEPAPPPGRTPSAVSALELEPIGWVESTLTDRSAAPRQGVEGAPDAWIRFDPRATPGLRDLVAGTDIFVLTWLHLARRDVLVVHPRGDRSNPTAGVFTTRSPDRPNPIGLHRVRVLAVDDGRLRVGPLEAVDGTPVVDIKPVLDRRWS